MKNFNIGGEIITDVSNETLCNIYKNIGIEFENNKFKCNSDFMSEYVFDDIFDIKTEELLGKEITINFNILDKVDRNVKANEYINFKIDKNGNVMKKYVPGTNLELKKEIIEEYNLNSELFLEIKRNEILKQIIELEITCGQINTENYKEQINKMVKIIGELNNNDIIS